VSRNGIQGLECLPCEDRLQVEVVCIAKRRLQGDLMAAFQYLKGACREDVEELHQRL